MTVKEFIESGGEIEECQWASFYIARRDGFVTVGFSQRQAVNRWKEISEKMDMGKQLIFLQKQIHETAKEKGWHDFKVPFATHIANLHGEVSEAWEWYRNGDKQSDHIPEFRGIEEEYADIIIRVLDSAAAEGIDVIGALFAKMKYNKGRSYRHGGKKA